MERRTFLKRGLVGGGAVAVSPFVGHDVDPTARVDNSQLQTQTQTFALPPIRSISPVVGDGRWVWNDPPAETGYLEPRDYELEIGIQLDASTPAQSLNATTPIPVDFPEQRIDDVKIEVNGCQAMFRRVSKQSAQLLLAAPYLAKGQTISAVCKIRLTLFKQYHAYAKEQFAAEQPQQPLGFRQQYLFDSPGIQTRAPEVRKLQKEITSGAAHPWDKAHKFYQWVWENIQARVGNYTNVVRALRSRVGDCEERAACFVALCRAAGIPARLVWVPNHNWAEFFLVDARNKGHWIPAHTSAYSWFGWTGAHELVIQKGDNLVVPEKRRPQRLLADWMQWHGGRPAVKFAAAIRPLPSSTGEDAGPGERVKDKKGEWVLQGSHQLDRSLRDGDLQYQHRGLRLND